MLREFESLPREYNVLAQIFYKYVQLHHALTVTDEKVLLKVENIDLLVDLFKLTNQKGLLAI